VPTFADRGVAWSAQRIPAAVNLCFLDRILVLIKYGIKPKNVGVTCFSRGLRAQQLRTTVRHFKCPKYFSSRDRDNVDQDRNNGRTIIRHTEQVQTEQGKIPILLMVHNKVIADYDTLLNPQAVK
jgi:hypothetical protein